MRNLRIRTTKQLLFFYNTTATPSDLASLRIAASAIRMKIKILREEFLTSGRRWGPFSNCIQPVLELHSFTALISA